MLARIVSVWPNICVTRNYVPEVAKHVDVRERPNGSLARCSSDDEPRVILERRIRLVEGWLDRQGGHPNDEAA